MVGAGNSSAQASLHIAHYARKVTIVMRGERLNENVSEYLVDRVMHAEYRTPCREQSCRSAW
jgi:thioredoxin reductase (NADPH)